MQGILEICQPIACLQRWDVNIFYDGSGLDVEYDRTFFDREIGLTANKIIRPGALSTCRSGKEVFMKGYEALKRILGSLCTDIPRNNGSLPTP